MTGFFFFPQVLNVNLNVKQKKRPPECLKAVLVILSGTSLIV